MGFYFLAVCRLALAGEFTGGDEGPVKVFEGFFALGFRGGDECVPAGGFFGAWGALEDAGAEFFDFSAGADFFR